MINLTPRLMTAVQLAKGAKRIIDVGCDHGYLSAYMVTDGGALFSYACDVNEGPLCKAKETIEQLNISDKVETVLCDGLKPFDGSEADAVFICGMGGELIADILDAVAWTSKGEHSFILQPMTRSEKLREYLENNGYHIEREVFVKEDFRLYCVMLVKGGIGDCGRNNRYLYADSALKNTAFFDYVGSQLNKLKHIVDEKVKAGYSVEDEMIAIKVLEDSNAH